MWSIAETLASDVLEADPEVVGFEAVAGVTTLHLAISEGLESVDVWVDASGLVMKLIWEEAEEGTSLQLQTVWEVTGLDIEPDEPLPPGA